MNLIFKADDPHQKAKDQFNQFLEEQSVPMRRAFDKFVQSMLNDVTDAQIKQWIDEKDLKGFLKYAADYIDEMSDTLPDTFVRAANAEIEELQRPGKFGIGKLGIEFDPGNNSAADLIESSRLQLVKDITSTQKDAIRSAISDALSSGDGPVSAARRFRSAIGLTENQYRAVQNYQSLLETNNRAALDRALSDARFDRTIARTFANDDVLSAKQIERMVGRYTENMRAYRAETIARTETMRVLNQAKQSAWEQIAEQLGINPSKVERIWISTLDDRVRDSHADMYGQTVTGLDTPFESGDGEELLYPGDPDASPEETINCRCTVVVRFPPAPRQVSKGFDPDEPRDEKGMWTSSGMSRKDMMKHVNKEKVGKYVYHGTSAENAKAIFKAGHLKPSQGSWITDKPAVHFAQDPVYSAGTATTNNKDGLLFRTPKDAVKWDKGARGPYTSSKKVPLSKLEVLTNKGWKKAG